MLALHRPVESAALESWVVAELYKAQVHRGEQPNFYHYRESRGLEMDVLVNLGESSQQRSGARLIAWRDVGGVFRNDLAIE